MAMIKNVINKEVVLQKEIKSIEKELRKEVITALDAHIDITREEINKVDRRQNNTIAHILELTRDLILEVNTIKDSIEKDKVLYATKIRSLEATNKHLTFILAVLACLAIVGIIK